MRFSISFHIRSMNNRFIFSALQLLNFIINLIIEFINNNIRTTPQMCQLLHMSFLDVPLQHQHNFSHIEVNFLSKRFVEQFLLIYFHLKLLHKDFFCSSEPTSHFFQILISTTVLLILTVHSVKWHLHLSTE